MPGTLPVLASGNPCKYPVTRSTQRRSAVHTFCDLSEQRYALGAIALTEFELVYNRITTADKNTLRAFYATQNGETATDWSFTLEGLTYSNCQFIGPFDAQCVGPHLWNVTLRFRYTSAAGSTEGFAAPPSGSTIILSVVTSVETTATFPVYQISLVSTNGHVGSLVAFVIDLGSVAYAKTTSTADLTPPLHGLANEYGPGFTVEFWADEGVLSPGGTLELDIYDCWLTITPPTGGPYTLRPTTAVIGYTNGTTTITPTDPNHYLLNPANAIDSDATTYATLFHNTAGGLANGAPYLQLGRFV